MKVKELKAALDSFDDDAEVMFAHPSHDHWRTVLASHVRTVEESEVAHSAYHDKDQVLDEEDGPHERDENRREVILLEA